MEKQSGKAVTVEIELISANPNVTSSWKNKMELEMVNVKGYNMKTDNGIMKWKDGMKISAKWIEGKNEMIKGSLSFINWLNG